MSDDGRFELEPDAPAEPRKPATPPLPGAVAEGASVPAPPRGAAARTPRTAAEAPPATGLLARLPPKLRRRLRWRVPSIAAAFLVVGWWFVGVGLWAFALAGALVGVFSSWKRPEEALLAAVAGAAGYAATAAAIRAVPLGLGMVFVVGICGLVGALVAIDDRLSGP
jgi:hypothetical protein